MKTRENPSLGLRVEVHQSISAHEQIQPRHGSILHQIVPTEDHRAAQVRVEHVPTTDGVKILLPKFFRHRLDLFGAITSLPRRCESVFVHVRGVDLDPLAKFLLP